MKWQDVLFSASALVFSLALIPMLRGTNHAPRKTSVPTALLLYAIAYAEFTIALPLAAALTVVQASMWGFIALLRHEDPRVSAWKRLDA